MLRYMLGMDICIYMIKNRSAGLRDRFDRMPGLSVENWV